MFMKLASSSMSAVFGSLGFVSMFILNIVGRRGLLPSLTGALFGALGFLAAWALIIVILGALFSEEELSRIFFKSSPQKTEILDNPPQNATEYKLDDSQGELTTEDLYGNSAEGPKIFAGLEAGSSGSHEHEHTDTVKTASRLDASGGFDFQSGDRVLRTNAKEAALAARKVLMNEKT